MANEKIINLNNLNRFKQKLNIELDKKANVDGNYPTMTVGAADSLTPYGENSGANDTTPFVMQSSGGSSDVGSKAYLRELRGNTVAFNQLVQNGNFASDSGWYPYQSTVAVSNNVGTLTMSSNASSARLQRESVTFISGNKYLIKETLKSSKATQIRIVVGEEIALEPQSLSANTKTVFSTIYTPVQTSNLLRLYINYGNDLDNGDTVEYSNVQVFDLTLLGTDYDTALAFNRDYPLPYYAYNTGTLLSCKSKKLVTTGKNQWDEIWGKVAPAYYGSVNFIPVIPGQTYYRSSPSNLFIRYFDGNQNELGNSLWGKNNTITLPDNCRYIKFYADPAYGATYNHDICIYLYWDGSRPGYEPYEVHEYDLPNIELRSAGSVYGVAYSTGGGKRRVGVVDLSTLGWIKYGDNQGVYRTNPANLTDMENTTTSSNSNHYLTCVLPEVSNNDAFAGTKECIAKELGRIIISIPSATDGTSLLQKLSGKMLNYPLATETDITVEENPGWQNPQDIDDFGTQEFLYDNDITIQVPQGNDFFYPVDYKAFIDSLGGRDDIEYAADQVVSQTQLTQALSTFLSSIQGYDATKTQTLKNVNGVFQWVDD